jgi:oligo-1,6-glucosidase
MKNTWWKENVVYQIYPRSFNDSNGDGIGDLRGIIHKLDYLKSLGIDIIWLGPCYKSPNDDNGYDIADYYDIMDEFGTMADFDELLEGLHQRGIKLIMDLVVNHTSDEHNWFEESRKSKDNPYRDYYIWRPGKNGGPPNNWWSIFGGSAWQYDEQTDEYYLHLFTKKQPDLNWENPKVREEVNKIMRFWLDKGVDGFRMDVISMISKQPGLPDIPDKAPFEWVLENVYANGPKVHEYIQDMYREVLSQYDIMTVGEGPGITPELAKLYVGEDRGELNLVFNLDHMFIDSGPGGKFDPVEWSLKDLRRIFSNWIQTLEGIGWTSVFLDNHDFARMVSRFGNDNKYRKESAKMLAIFLLTMKGTPCIYQGSEIGMTNVAFPSLQDYRDVETLNYFREKQKEGLTEEEFLPVVYALGRDNVRTPIQWENRPHGGFTTGEPWLKVNPNYPEINVKEAEDDPDSILHFYRRILAFRKEHPALVYGSYQDISKDHPKLFVYERKHDSEYLLIALNFSDEELSYGLPQPVNSLDLIFSNYENGKEKGTFLPWEGKVFRVKGRINES